MPARLDNASCISRTTASPRPQVGHFFPVGKEKGYVNLKGYWEFDAENRAEGWNLWLSLALPLSMGR